MSSRRRQAVLAGTITAAAAWMALWRIDRRRVRRDPAHGLLAAPLEGRALEVRSEDGTDLHAEIFGPDDAPTIVLVHGWTCAIAFWTRQIQELSQEMRVVAYDLRGHGRSAVATGGDYSVDAHAADLEAVLRATVPAQERPVVAAHSLGAMTLVAWAGEYAGDVDQRIAAAALVNTGVGDLISESLVLRAPTRLQAVSRALGRVVLSASAPLPKGTTPLSHRLVRYIALSPKASPAEVAFCERIILEARRDVRAACGGVMCELDLYHALQDLSVPTVVIAGGSDRLTPVAHARRMTEALPEVCELLILPDAGHMSPVSDCEVVTRRLRQLVLDTRRSPRPTRPTALAAAV